MSGPARRQCERLLLSFWLLQACGCGPADLGSASAVQAKPLRSQPCPENAARERSRVRNLRQAFTSLQVGPGGQAVSTATSLPHHA